MLRILEADKAQSQMLSCREIATGLRDGFDPDKMKEADYQVS